MKNILIGGIIALLTVGMISAVYVTSENRKCRECWDRMDSFTKCVKTPGCLYDADMWFEAKKAHSYYDIFCKAEDKK